MNPETPEISKYDIQYLYDYMFRNTKPGCTNNLYTFARTPLSFTLSDAGDHAWLLSGLGAHFSVNMEDGYVVFSLFNTDIGSPKRHPLFFGGEFIDQSIFHFINFGFEVYGIYSVWVPGSINYDKYMNLTEKGIDSNSALRMTWTGQQAARHLFFPEQGMPIVGFNEIAGKRMRYLTVKFSHIQS